MIRKNINDGALNILLVEDNPAHAELVIRSLKDHALNSSIYHVTNGELALDYLFRRSAFTDEAEFPLPHIILLDIRMPKVNGIDVLKAIKSTESLRHIPVVILTTSDADRDVASAYRNYVNSYLVKPVEFDKFMKLMEELGFYWLKWNHHKKAFPGTP